MAYLQLQVHTIHFLCTKRKHFCLLTLLVVLLKQTVVCFQIYCSYLWNLKLHLYFTDLQLDLYLIWVTKIQKCIFPKCKPVCFSQIPYCLMRHFICQWKVVCTFTYQRYFKKLKSFWFFRNRYSKVSHQYNSDLMQRRRKHTSVKIIFLLAESKLYDENTNF